LGTHSAITFRPLWELVGNWKCYFYITDGWPVYPMFIPDGDQIICKTYMTRVEGENTRLRHYLARLHRKTLCYSKSVEMLKHSMRLVIHYLKFWEVPVPYPSYHFKRALAEANRVAKTSLDPTNHTSIQQRQIYLPKLGWMRFDNSRSMPDGFTIKACAVRKRENGWYVSVRIEDKSVPDYLAKSLKDVVKVI
jgi:IS1 family transposase